MATDRLVDTLALCFGQRRVFGEPIVRVFCRVGRCQVALRRVLRKVDDIMEQRGGRDDKPGLLLSVRLGIAQVASVHKHAPEVTPVMATILGHGFVHV